MRFVRVVLGLVLAVAGLVTTIAGAASAFWLVGPDDTVDLGDQHLASEGLAVATAPGLLDRHGPTLHVTASDSPRPVFVGIGQDLDVASYLGSSAYTRVVRLALPPTVETQEMKGGTARLNPPGSLDWWTAQANGPGRQSVAWPMADGAYDVVVMNADGTPGTDARVSLAVELPGLFLTCLLVLLGGVVLLVLGLVLMFLRRRRPEPPAPVVPPYRGARESGYESAPQYEGVGVPQYQRVLSPPRGGPAGRTAVIAAGLTLLLAATGCAAVPERNVSPRAATRPAVTVADGQAAVKRYNQLNNQANQTRDEKLSETIEADPTLAMTRAGHRIGRTLDAAGREKIESFTYTEPQIGAPSFGAYPMRFVVSSGVSGSPDNRHLGVWERADAGAPWVLKYSVYPATTEKLPPLGGLRPAAKEDLDELASLPRRAADDLSRYLSDGSGSPKATQFAVSPSTAGLLDARAKTKRADVQQPYIASVSDTFRPSGEPLTFITSSGEALVFLALTERYLQRIEPGSNALWARGAATAFSNRVEYTQTLTQDYLHQVALLIPQKSTGKPRVLSINSQLVGAGGS